jgi:hypothetical protein
MSQNFPVHASSLSTAKVDMKDLLKTECKTNRHVLGNMLGLLSINGIPLSLSPTSFNIFTVLETLQYETDFFSMLSLDDEGSSFAPSILLNFIHDLILSQRTMWLQTVIYWRQMMQPISWLLLDT